MSPFQRIAIAARRAGVQFPLSASGFLLALLFAACGDTQVAGTSSGVDNPALTVGFRDAGGAALRVTGDLNVYSVDQNPAVDPQPLVTIKVRNSSFTNLTGDDFARLQQGLSKQGAASLPKTAARGAAVGAGDSASTIFNIILTTQDRTGNLVIGIKYDSASREFSRVGGSVLTRVDVQPRPLVRFEAKIARDSVHGDAGRIFVPGTPYLATVVDSTFIIEDLPEGIFPIRLLAADGKVYPIGDSLNTQNDLRLFRPLPNPVGVIDTTGGKDSIPEFSVTVGANHQAVIELPSFLEATVSGAGKTDPRLSFLWRLIKDAGDSGRADTLLHDTLPPPKPGETRRAEIVSPTSLRSEVRFSAEGVYQFEIAATIGLRTRTDTVVISVSKLPPPPTPRIIQPRPGDSLVEGRSYNIQWEMPDKGPVTIQVSVNNGETWSSLAEHYSGKDSLPIFPWIPAKTLGVSQRCLIQVTNDAAPTLRARMEKPFNLLQ
ncbi:MAG: hypothetical protein JWO30_2211 [Fibrobacteres bacterium]|nr:hypothetical protein [Fibrobacterota bacterium]